MSRTYAVKPVAWSVPGGVDRASTYGTAYMPILIKDGHVFQTVDIEKMDSVYGFDDPAAAFKAIEACKAEDERREAESLYDDSDYRLRDSGREDFHADS
jgi:hypothetical protein